MNTTTALRRFLRPLLAAGLLLAALFPLRVHGQYSSYSYPMYYPSGPPATMRAPSGSAGFEVPLERAGHYFSFKWRVRAADPISTGSAQTMGFVTASNVAGDTTMRSVVVTAYTPSTYSYTPFTYTYPGTNYTYTSFTYTSVPFACFDWWLVDNTANEEFYHAGTPGPAENLRNVAWRQLGSIPTRYFTIPETRFGHALVAGSPAGGWSPVTTGYYTFGTYSNGTSGTQVPLHWFTGSAPVGAGDFSIADRNDGTKAPLNQTNVSATTWVHDYSVYPLASVTFYLPAAELNNLYVLHYQIPGQVAAAMTLWPTAVSQGLNTPTVNAGTKTIPVGAATVTGAVAVGANFWLTRNLDNYSAPPYSTPPFALTAALANATTLKRWWLAPPPAAVTRDAVTFGIASTRAAQTFTVSQPSSKSPTSPELGGAAARPILTYQDYAANGSANSFNYFTVTALVNRAEPFNLVTQTGSATEMFSQGQLWVLDGWIPIGGTAGTLPAGTPGQFNFALKVSGPEPATGLSLTAPDGTFYPLVPSAPTTHTFADVWHPGTNWTAVEKTWTLSLAYTGAMGGWWLANAADQDLSLSLNVGNTANYHRDLGYQATVRPLVLEVSLSRWALDTAPRLRLRQRDGSDFPVTASNTTEWSSQTPDARVWSSSAYLFHADTYARDGVDYWLYDEKTGEESPYNTTDLITWFALPTPAGLTGAVNATTGAITLQWPLGFAALEGSFIVERQLSGESAWQTIETLTAEFADGNNELHFTDPAPVLGKVHSYQVRYTYGGGAAQRRSARSNRVVLTGWQDSDSDGLPDWWEVKYGLNPNNPADAGTPIIPGDMTPLEKHPKGGDPTTADTDGDGVADVNDAYLTDNRRSHILPVTRYVAVDISTPAIGTTDVWSAALDDSGQAAFAWNDAGKKEYESDVWRNYVIVQKLRLPFEYKPPSQLFIKTYPPEYNLPPAELLAVQTWWYEPKMVNASGALAGSRFAQAQIYTKAGDGADLSGLVPPDPQKPEYVIWLKTATGNDSLNWAGGARPDPVFSTHHMYYTDLHGNLGLGITNSGTLWGWNGESAYYGTFIGDTHFGVMAGIRPFDFGIYAAVQNISGNGNAVGIASIWENWASTPAAWLNTGGGFFTVFGNDSTSSSTYIGIDDSAEILGFSDRFPRAAWFPHADETVQHAFWYTDNAPTDFYSAIPEGYGSHIAFTQRPGAPLFSANGDMMFTAQIADLAANGQKIWRDGTLLWNRQKQTLSEVEIPEFATFGTKMTNDHAMVTLQWQQPQDANGHDDLTKPRYRAAMLLLPVEFNLMWETKNKANQIWNPTWKDDPVTLTQAPNSVNQLDGVPRNKLYLVTDPADGKYRVTLELELAEAFRTKFMAAAYVGDTKVAGSDKAFTAEGKCNLEFAHLGTGGANIADFAIRIGYDADNSGTLDPSEQIKLSIPTTSAKNANGEPIVRGSNAQAHANAKSSIDNIVGLTPLVLPHASRLLQIFRDGTADYLPNSKKPTSTATVNFNCFNGAYCEWITHNTGATFDDSGNAEIKEYTWESETSLADMVGNSSQVVEPLVTYYRTDVASQVTAYFAGKPVGTVKTFPADGQAYEIPHEHQSPAWVTPTTVIFFTLSPPLPDVFANVDDLNGAVGRGRLIGQGAQYTVEMKLVDTVPTPVVTSVRTAGIVEDLYDFNHDVGGQSRNAAILQIGFGNGGYGTARRYGMIYRDKIHFDVTFDHLP